jgi:bacterioferritin
MTTATTTDTTKIARENLIEKLNEDLAREYQAIIAYVTYSQVLKGAEYMAIAAELEVHAGQELQHALTIAKQIDYLGGTPTTTALPVKQTRDAREMLRADLDNETATVRAYRERVVQCEALQEYAIAEDIREILRQEQEHQIDLATRSVKTCPTCRDPKSRHVSDASAATRRARPQGCVKKAAASAGLARSHLQCATAFQRHGPSPGVTIRIFRPFPPTRSNC